MLSQRHGHEQNKSKLAAHDQREKSRGQRKNAKCDTLKDQGQFHHKKASKVGNRNWTKQKRAINANSDSERSEPVSS